MQIHELVELARFLKFFVEENNIAGMYQELIDSVNAAAQNQNPQDVRANLDKLRKLHINAENRVLSPARRKLMEHYGADELLGRKAIDFLDTTFAENQAHPQGLTQALQKQLKQIKQLVQRASQLISALEPLIHDLGLDVGELGKNEGRLWLYFADATSVNTIEDLEKAAITWKQILHHFSRMPDASADSGRILQISKHSPLEIELASNVAVLVPLAFGIKWVLNRIEHVIKICQQAEKLKQLKVNTKIINDLYADADEQRKKIANEAADAIKEKFEAENEARNAVKKGLDTIIEFIEGGGQLDIDVDDKNSEDAEQENENGSRAELRKLIADIRNDIKLLPYGLSGSNQKDTTEKG